MRVDGEASFTRVPAPLIDPDRVWSALEAYLSVPALLMLAAYDPAFNWPAPPITRVPRVLVMAPVKVLVPVRVRVEAALVSLVRPPAPEITPERVWSAEEL